jgi:hypothetical protein
MINKKFLENPVALGLIFIGDNNALFTYHGQGS